MAKTRLTADIKQRLISKARKCSTDKTEITIALSQLLAQIVLYAKIKWDKSDMLVLQKYDMACIPLALDLKVTDDIHSRYWTHRVEIILDGFAIGDDLAFLAPKQMYHNPMLEIVSTNEVLLQSIDEYKAAHQSYKSDIRTLIHNYRILIENTKYAEDLLAKWPDSADIINPFIESKSKKSIDAALDKIATLQVDEVENE